MAKFTGKTPATEPHQTETPEPSIAEDASTSLEVDLNIGRRKRRKTEPPEDRKGLPITVAATSDTEIMEQTSWRDQLELKAGGTSRDGKTNAPLSPGIVSETPMRKGESGVDQVPSSPPVLMAGLHPQEQPNETSARSTTPTPSPSNHSPPRKMLRLNAKGKFSSPAKQGRSSTAERPATTTPKRRRKRKQDSKSLVVKLCYHVDEKTQHRTGTKINEILSGAARYKAPEPMAQVQRRPPPQSSGPPKPKHPLFMSKAEKEALDRANAREDIASKPAKPSPRKTATATPGKLRAQLRGRPADAGDSYSSKPLFGDMRAAGLQKQPGSVDASWPWQGLSHVHGLDLSHDSVEMPHDLTELPDSRKKSKHHSTPVKDEDNVIASLARSLGPKDAFTSAPLRLPHRLLTNGRAIQEAVEDELRTSICSVKGSRWLRRLNDSIQDTLTPFNLGKCEQQSWTHKYAPSAAEEVLQSGNEVTALRDWLKCLTVSSTESGVRPSNKNDEKEKKRKKRKRRGSDLDDFIVDDDAASLDELTDPEDGVPLPPEQRSMLRTIGANSSKKLANVILLTGPHGCGKTAAAYAVAKELGFEVFEINPGTRRSGKDIMDRIGDMTENHLIRQEVVRDLQLDGADDVSETVPQVDGPPDRTKEEVASGRQATMASFFQATKTKKPNPAVKPKPKPSKSLTKPPLSKARTGHHKQSLILLEEVDVLFEEDQGFWATVRALATYSKRPIIMTCNDENLVKIEEDAIQGILRFKPPSLELATDYMLLIAAAEGHLLQREAIEALYRSRDQDLRASITELNFWCQMAIGDTKGGLEWTYQRWPPGNDIDEQGRTLRVASQNTYRKGMGWNSREAVCNTRPDLQIAEELLHESWQWWAIRPDELVSSVSVCAAAADPTNIHSKRSRALAALEAVEQRAEAFSSVDVFTHLCQSTPCMDTTLPDLSVRTKQSFTEGYPLLEAEVVSDLSDLKPRMACQMALLATRCYNDPDSVDMTGSLPDEKSVQASILNTLSSHYNPQGITGSSIMTILDPLTVSHASSLGFGGPTVTASTLTSLARPLSIITSDIAPYVRSIAAYDMHLEAQRLRLSSLLSEGGGGSERRMRKTRAARSALEGGARETTRRERWFRGLAELNLQMVMDTGGKEWAGKGLLDVAEESAGGDITSMAGSASVQDVYVGNLQGSQSSV